MKQQPARHPRRIASNEVMTTEGQCLTRYVVELSEDATVLNLYPLTQEIAYTEWMQGRLVLKSENGHTRVYYNNKVIS